MFESVPREASREYDRPMQWSSNVDALITESPNTRSTQTDMGG